MEGVRKTAQHELQVPTDGAKVELTSGEVLSDDDPASVVPGGTTAILRPGCVNRSKSAHETLVCAVEKLG